MTLRAFLLSLVLLSLGSVWLEKAELITFAANLSNAVPPIQALAGLILLRVLNALLKRWLPRFALTQGEMTVMFIFLCAAMAMMSLGILRFFFPALTALRYFATPENKYGELTSHLPSWFAPSSERASALGRLADAAGRVGRVLSAVLLRDVVPPRVVLSPLDGERAANVSSR
jgi:hypothetical protein